MSIKDMQFVTIQEVHLLRNAGIFLETKIKELEAANAELKAKLTRYETTEVVDTLMLAGVEYLVLVAPNKGV